jgi:GntR family transcriptional regulator
MLFLVDAHSGVPVFRQIMQQTRLAIAAGRLGAGDPLPSVRSLALTLGVNPMTISKAYNLLEHEGVLERRPGKPLVVAAAAPEARSTRRLNRLESALRPVAALCIALDIEPDEAVALLRRLLAEEQNPS